MGGGKYAYFPIMYRAHRQVQEGSGVDAVEDVFDGTHFRRMFYQPEDMAFGLTFDGFQVASRNLSSCCPIVLSCLNLPPPPSGARPSG